MDRHRQITRAKARVKKAFLRGAIGGERQPTFAAITARSYHPGGINVLLGDGSVRFVKSTVNGLTWRALGTVSGGEVVSSDAYRATPVAAS